MERSSRQKSTWKNWPFGQINAMYTYKHIYGTFQPKVDEYIFFSGVHGTFSRIDHMLKQASKN